MKGLERYIDQYYPTTPEEIRQEFIDSTIIYALESGRATYSFLEYLSKYHPNIIYPDKLLEKNLDFLPEWKRTILYHALMSEQRHNPYYVRGLINTEKAGLLAYECLFDAIREGNADIMMILVENGVNLFQRVNGKDAIDIALESKSHNRQRILYDLFQWTMYMQGLTSLISENDLRALLGRYAENDSEAENILLKKGYKTITLPIPRYELTQRPISQMKFMGNIATYCQTGYYLPVIRYGTPYHVQERTQEEHCGVFYYYEPESKILFKCGKYVDYSK